jgi:hypothetical protein
MEGYPGFGHQLVDFSFPVNEVMGRNAHFFKNARNPVYRKRGLGILDRIAAKVHDQMGDIIRLGTGTRALVGQGPDYHRQIGGRVRTDAAQRKAQPKTKDSFLHWMVDYVILQNKANLGRMAMLPPNRVGIS